MTAYEFRDVPPDRLPTGRVAGLRTAPGRVTLELPRRGRVTVAGDRVLVEAAAGFGSFLPAELATWIRGQQLRQAGLLALGGSCVERDGRAVVLAARPRNGASFAALGLVRAGWQLVSDGVTGLRRTDEGYAALPGRPAIELDAAAVAPGSTLPVRPTGTGTPRVLADVPHTTLETPVDAVVILVARMNLREPAVIPADPDTAPARLATTAVPDLADPGRSKGPVADLVAAVPVTTLLLPVRASSPADLADALLGILEPVGAA